ncbi:hypothetical protein ABTM69_19875, partial [Acinetobacter baumannii]
RTSGIVYFDINDESGKKLKTKSSKRQVPLHPILNDIGFEEYVAARKVETLDELALLFPGLEPRGKKAQRWAGAWSKWFNRWRREKLKIVGDD